jgi:isoleucyl-tRNA synthetase
MSDENNYAIWHFLKVCHERGWVYKGHDVVPWCYRCETAISQHEILTEDYKEVSHESIFVNLPIEGRDEYLLVWTTTPWTLPANIAVAVDKDFDYALVQTKGGKKLWLLKELAESVLGEDFDRVLKTVKGKELVGLKYTPPFHDLPIVKKTPYHKVVATDKLIMPITTTEGTGLVHTSTGTGAEDYQLGKKLGLPVIAAITDDARYLDGFGTLSGQNAKVHPELIFDRLGDFKYKILKYKHRYPACWRCKTELVWKLTDEYYIAMDKVDPTDTKKRTLRKEIIDVAKKINWIPQFGLERELDWLNNMHDWLISKKNRFWGLALPIYECTKCGTIEVIGGKEELKQKAVSGWDKFEGHTPHKPWIDEVKIKCPKCGEEVSRIEPVGNPWLDAGIVPFSTMPSEWFPANFITEAFPGQFKNWFYAMLVMATVLKKTNPYQTVLGYESVVGEDGRPMHKSWGNSVEFNEGASKIGVDVMRWLYSRVLPTAVLPFGYKSASEVRRQFVLILWNSYRFFVTQVKEDKTKSGHVLDKWILSRLSQTIKAVTESLDQYYSAPATAAIESLVNDFSTWYLRRSRDRQAGVYQTMLEVLVTLSKLLAPFMPYLADTMYTNLTGQESVHLTDWPKVNEQLVDAKLEAEMGRVRLVVEAIHRERKLKNLKVRQPLKEATVSTKKLDRQLEQLVLEETNIKSLTYELKEGELTAKLDEVITPELKAEGDAREIVRQIQGARKEAQTTLDELVEIELPSWPKEFEGYIKDHALVKNLKQSPQFKLVRLK